LKPFSEKSLVAACRIIFFLDISWPNNLKKSTEHSVSF
jgi:nucleoside recognition membrane protein YjiH